MENLGSFLPCLAARGGVWLEARSRLNEWTAAIHKSPAFLHRAVSGSSGVTVVLVTQRPR